ncbi:MAG: OmpA family protein [Proteobacteria bacterium]|nr:OmpA family protein [Pseudomonadota bacterium]
MKRTLALAALMTGAAGVAHATEGWYVRGDVGQSISTDFANLDVQNGFVGDVGAGYTWDNGFRLEAELSYRKNKWDFVRQQSGDLIAWGLMANVFYDFNRQGHIRPYLGVGAGEGRLRIQVNGSSSHPEDDGFAYQGLAGVGIALNDQATLDIGYRYFRINDVLGDDYTNQAVMVGLRYEFAAPPPPPPPPPPVQPPPPPPPARVACPTSDFVVYFEWDRSNLNQAALETIDQAVAHARECDVSSVLVVGHTDTSGSAQYNMGLSERRASVVRDALVARGIGAGSIQTQAHGESDLARPTRDGVREPLNRRTAVTISFQ